MGEIKLTVMGPNDVKQEIRDTVSWAYLPVQQTLL